MPFGRMKRGSGCVGLVRQLALEDVADDRRDLGSLAFEREMAGFEQVDFGVRLVALERLCTGWQEERIILAPYGEKWRPQVRIDREIVLLVTEQIELDFVLTDFLRAQTPSAMLRACDLARVLHI